MPDPKSDPKTDPQLAPPGALVSRPASDSKLKAPGAREQNEMTPEQRAAWEAKRQEHKFRRLRRKAREAEGEIEELNITPMLDMMTIILVFLLKSYNSSTVRSENRMVSLSSAIETAVMVLNKQLRTAFSIVALLLEVYCTSMGRDLLQEMGDVQRRPMI